MLCMGGLLEKGCDSTLVFCYGWIASIDSDPGSNVLDDFLEWLDSIIN